MHSEKLSNFPSWLKISSHFYVLSIRFSLFLEEEEYERIKVESDCDDLEGLDGGWSEREAKERGDMYIHIADSGCCTAETNITILQ